MKDEKRQKLIEAIMLEVSRCWDRDLLSALLDDLSPYTETGDWGLVRDNIEKDIKRAVDNQDLDDDQEEALELHIDIFSALIFCHDDEILDGVLNDLLVNA